MEKSSNCNCGVNRQNPKPFLPDAIALLLVFLKLSGKLDFVNWGWIAFSPVIVIIVQNLVSAVGMAVIGLLYGFSRLFVRIDKINKGDK